MDTAANMVERRRAIRGDRVATGDADPLRSLAAGLQELELPFRATLELRYRRGLDDETIAAVAQFGQDEIQRQRRRALVWLAQRTGTRGPDAIEIVERGLASLTPAAWAGEPEPELPADPEPESAPEPVPDPSPAPESELVPDPQPEPVTVEPTSGPEQIAPEAPTEAPPLAVSVPPPRSPSAGRPIPQPKPFPTPAKKQGSDSQESRKRLLGLVALLAAVVALFLIVTSGGDDDAGPTPAPPVTESKGSGSKADKGNDAAPAANAVTMDFVPGADATGEVDVSLSGAEAQPDIEIKLDGLAAPDGEYRGWLYNSVIDSRTLGRARSGDGLISATLPKGWQDYGFIDLSVQEPDSIVHSGRSVARIAIADLPAP